jgi:predicted nucleic acid-binding protein
MAQKKIVLCDSNVLFEYFRGTPVMLQELDELGFSRLALSVISEAEMYVGMRRTERRKTTETINKFNIIGLDAEISRTLLRLTWEHHTKRPGIADMLIAATALTYPVKLFTFNKKDFDFIEGITFYRPKYQHQFGPKQD